MYNKKLLLFLILLAGIAVLTFPLTGSARPHYTTATGNPCTYCHNKDNSLNVNGQAFVAAGKPAVHGWKNPVMGPKKPVVTITTEDDISKKENKKYKKLKIRYHDDDDEDDDNDHEDEHEDD